MKNTLVLKNATLLPEYGFGQRKVYVVIRNQKINKIAEVLPKEELEGEVIDCGGNLLIPAFYNSHCHAAMTLFRGYGEDLPLQKWLDEKILPAEDKLTFRSVYHASKLAIAEMLKNGIASFTDMYMFEDATAEAVLETGIKANLSRCIVTFDPKADFNQDHRINEARRLVEWYHGYDNDRLKIDMALHAEYTNVPEGCRFVADLAKRLGVRMHIHLSETKYEQEKCFKRWNKTPTEFFLETGVLDCPTTAAHGVFVTDSDMEILAKKKVTISHNPVSNLKLGSGVLPLKKVMDAGINVALGTDGVASNNRLDILRELQNTALVQKGINYNPAIIPSKNLFPLATRNGALSQGRENCGKIEIGYKADLVLLDRNSLHNIPNYDDYAMLAFSAQSSDVLMTMVDGRILYRNGEYTSIDEERLRYDCREVFAHYFD